MDLFNDDQGESLAMADADLTLWRHLELGDDLRLLERLIAETPWREESVTLWGKTYLQPRLIAWYGDAGIHYTYSGSTLVATPWTPLLLDIKARIEKCCGYTFNSVLINYYRHNRDSMGFHSDDEPELGQRPIIASLSLGEQRRFVFKHKHRKDVKQVSLVLPSGSLLLMAGDTQRYWKHGIPKETALCGPRVNLTFRMIYQ